MSKQLFHSQYLTQLERIFNTDSPSDALENLVHEIAKITQADAVALLQYHGGILTPVASWGLDREIRGRRFTASSQPRFDMILKHNESIRFPTDTPLPDPYDGLVPGCGKHLDVHDCIGMTISFNSTIWGVLTLDAMTPGKLASLTKQELDKLQRWLCTLLPAIHRWQRLDALPKSKQHLTMLTQPNREILGESSAINHLKDAIKQVATSDLPVLISGETGTGKELVAHAIHQYSARTDKNLVYLNCAALPENLVESELFGHVKGAFSGASDNRQGRFETANGGTLFLDEIGELPIGLQPKLLRAIQFGEIQRVGSDARRHVDVRILAATNRDLANEIKAGRFRADLYHRLCVFPIHVPSLRDRQEDIPILSGFFLERIREQFGFTNLRLSNSATALFQQYHWPGNVRELEHCLSRAALKARTRETTAVRMLVIDREDIDLLSNDFASDKTSTASLNANQSQSITMTLKDATDQFQREFLTKKYVEHQHNWARVARDAGIHRSNLHRLIKRLGIEN